MRSKNLIRAFMTLHILCAITLDATSQQNWDTLPWKSYADYKLQYLNKNLIATNILYDRMFPLANVDEYTGLPYDTNTDTTHPDHLMQAYYELFHLAYNTSGWTTPQALDAALDINPGIDNGIPVG